MGFIGQRAYALAPITYDQRDVFMDLIVTYVGSKSVMRGQSRWQRLVASHASIIPCFSKEEVIGWDWTSKAKDEDPTGQYFGLENLFLPCAIASHLCQAITLKTNKQTNLILKADGFST